MKHLDKALVAAGATLLLSGGIAAAALGPSNIGTAVMSSLPGDVALAVNDHRIAFGGKGLLTAAATYLGISEDALRAELSAGKSLADVAVASGKTRDGLVAALVQTATAEIATLVDTKGVFPAPHAGGPVMGRPHFGADLDAAATYLGVTEADLRTKLQAGQTLAAIANATAGKSRDGLVNALVADATADIDAAQSAGRITAEQATAAKAKLAAKIAEMVDSTRPMGPRFGFGHRGGR